jgi:hypothetical protein
VRWLGVAAVVAVVALAGCKSDESSAKPKYPKQFSFAADLRLSGPGNVYGFLDNCRGKGKYADLKTGAPVKVTTPQGVRLADGSIQYSTGTETKDQVLEECQFRVAVRNMPRRKSYLITIGDQKPIPVTIERLFTQVPLQLDANTPLVTLPTTTTT